MGSTRYAKPCQCCPCPSPAAPLPSSCHMKRSVPSHSPAAFPVPTPQRCCCLAAPRCEDQSALSTYRIVTISRRLCQKIMGDQGLERVQYVSCIRSIRPRCTGCLDMNPTIFDWRAVTWATSYPTLDPRRIAEGARSGCMSCAIVNAAFDGIGICLRTTSDGQRLSLYKKDQDGSLLAQISDDERCKTIEFYTSSGKALSYLGDLLHRKLYGTCNYLLSVH